MSYPCSHRTLLSHAFHGVPFMASCTCRWYSNSLHFDALTVKIFHFYALTAHWRSVSVVKHRIRLRNIEMLTSHRMFPLPYCRRRYQCVSNGLTFRTNAPASSLDFMSGSETISISPQPALFKSINIFDGSKSRMLLPESCSIEFW